MLKIVSLGGFGRVTSNMFVYELEEDILLVDCGMGFPTEDMLGVDILIPDISYLKNKKNKIRGLVLTHGHEDHTGALPYILPEINVPVYGSKLTAHLVMEKLAEYQNMPKQINILEPNKPLALGKFIVESVRISHSIPDATNLIIKTSVGTVYHGSDFKFDFTPVDGIKPDLGRIAKAGNEGVKLVLSDCLGSGRRGYTKSEKSLEETFEKEISHCQGKFIVTTMGSNISRWKQAAEAAIAHGRKIAILGRSIERNIKVASELGYFQLSAKAFVTPKQASHLKPNQVCLLVAGAMAQSGSALERLATGDNRDLQILPGDKIIFSADPIPGSESAVFTLIDALAKLGAEAVYSDVTDNLHVSGHGAQGDLLLLMNLVRPEYLLPIGGTFIHMVQYAKLAEGTGYSKDKVLLPEVNQIIEIDESGVKLGAKIEVRNVMVDGLGVGDVGQVVLRDRKVLAEEGVVVAVIEVNQNDLSKIETVDLISRGFVFAKEAGDILVKGAEEVKRAVAARSGKIESDRFIKSITVDVLEKFFFNATRRRPMILPVVVEV